MDYLGSLTTPTDRLMQTLQSAKASPMSTLRTQADAFIYKYTEPKTYPITDHLKTLAKCKPEYHSRDFFLNKDFRGLFLADHQEAIGERAFECVDELNRTVLTQFRTLEGFNDAI